MFLWIKRKSITDDRTDSFSCCLSILFFQLRQLLKAKADRNFVATCSRQQGRKLIEIQSRAFINNYGSGIITRCINKSGKTVNDKGVQGTVHTLCFGAVCNNKIAWVFRVGNLKIEIIPGKHPEGFFCRQSGQLDFQVPTGLQPQTCRQPRREKR